MRVTFKLEESDRATEGAGLFKLEGPDWGMGTFKLEGSDRGAEGVAGDPSNLWGQTGARKARDLS